MRMREAFFFQIDNEIDCALRPARDRFGFMTGNGAEAETGKKLPEFRGGVVIDSKFDEFDAQTLRSRWQLRSVVAGKCRFLPVIDPSDR